MSRELASRIPLRNLNWQSPPRPLRQIKSLHLDFVPDKDTKSSLRPDLSRTDSNGPTNSFEIVRGGSDARKPSTKQRRHQIPGFRTSPYLKIYILRCDDKETYKETARRQIREWIRESAQPEGKRDQHDAFQWLILHVVIPGTIAASEPRWRESAKDPEELKERKGGNKLIGKSTRTVFDRLRADFNESGKAGQDRVAQIRLPKESIPADLLPTPAAATTLEESPQERENAWHDLIAKFKTLILEPFDRRVRQYEADIAEQESRRSMPGWNFCTFFIHKEGLAKALESIGLVEDALAIYDELSLGLENVLRDIAAGQARGTATSFAQYTDDIKDRILEVTGEYSNGESDQTTNDTENPTALFSKNYRELIVRSDISVFDFLCYIFHRQKTLVLRLANSKSARVQLGADASREGGEDLVLASEVCWRTSIFMHNAARALRRDLTESASLDERTGTATDIEGLICSWSWTVASQVLAETAVPALLDVTRSSGRRSGSLINGQSKRPPMGIGLGANTHPQRTTSLPVQRLQAADPQRIASRPRTQDDDNALRPTLSAGSDPATPAGIPGQAELATYRAELVLIQRKVLEQSAAKHGWRVGWNMVRHAASDREGCKSDHSPGDDEAHTEEWSHSEQQGLNRALSNALRSEATFRSIFERLTDSAIRHYFAATQSKSAETLLGDMAMLKCYQHEYESAALYFQHILTPVSNSNWKSMEIQALNAYSLCLKQLGRIPEYVQNTLALLAKIVSKALNHDTGRRHFQAVQNVADKAFDASGLLQDCIAMSVKLEQELLQPLKTFFGEAHVSREVRHNEDCDGFLLSLQVRHVIVDEVTLDAVCVRLVSYDDPSQEIWLSSDGSVALTPGFNVIDLRTRTVAYGPYLIDKIVFRANKISFVEELRPAQQPTPLEFTEAVPPYVTTKEAEKPPPFVFLYPSERSFNIELRRCKDIHIDRARNLELHLDAGYSAIEAIEMRMKPTSAGLRLHLADSTSDNIVLDSQENLEPGQLRLTTLDAGASAIVTIPYTLENRNRELSVRLEIHYQTRHGTFTFLESTRLQNELPLDVDVNDIFHLDALYSHFIVRSTAHTPFAVLDVDLKDSPVYAVEKPASLPLPLTVYKAQPLKLIYKITRKQLMDNHTLKRDAALALRVLYQPMDSLLVNLIRKTFEHDLERSPFIGFRRLLVPLLRQRASQALKATNLEMAAFLEEASCPSFDSIGWHEIMDALPNDARSSLITWLQDWHESHALIPLGVDRTDRTVTQSITISVDVPNIDMVFNAALDLEDINALATQRPPIVALGQSVQAQVRIRHTDQWSTKRVFPNVPTFKIQGEEAAFACDVNADPETWIIGGRRRCHFTPQEGLEHAFNIVLVPMRLGIHPLPQLEVHQESKHHDAASVATDGPTVSCETNYESAGRLVQVIRDVRTSRVHVAESPASVALPPSRPGTASTKEYG